MRSSITASIGHLVAMAFVALTATGTPLVSVPAGASTDVPGLDALTHRVLLMMATGGPYSDPRFTVPYHFVLYEDGLVLYRTSAGDTADIMEAQVSPEEARAFVEEIVGYGFTDLAQNYSVVEASDQVGAGILLRQGGAWHGVEVYGLDRFGRFTCCDDHADEPPPAFTAALRRMTSFVAPGAKPWKPQHFEIFMSDNAVHQFPAEAQPPTPWPSGLPAPTTDRRTAYARRVYDMKFADLASTVHRTLAEPPVGLDGRSWRVSSPMPTVPESDYTVKVWDALRARERAVK
jgi:hypothetical protein